ncbi:MAG TPA: TatD family hydrolase [Candidatus Saccharimonadales bacterium]|nr:TatD family hydrolase [Candidatus Saccharimonadales bacterium]
MQLVDTHCHIHEAVRSPLAEPHVQGMWQKAEVSDPDQLVARAEAQGVTKLICVGTSANDSRLAVDFVANRENCWASIGIHPHEAKDGEAAFEVLRELVGDAAGASSGHSIVGKTGSAALMRKRAKSSKIIAIGECGLDYFYTHSPKQDQIKALHFQIQLALAHDLPLIFHVRNAFDDFWPIFDSYQNVRGVLHSFTDSMANMQKAIDRGLYIGANGIMTFTKDQAQLDTIRAVPLQKLLLETDAPFLTPKPFRGKVNMPANVSVVAEFLAELRGEPLQGLAEATTRNSQTLFSF